MSLPPYLTRLLHAGVASRYRSKDGDRIWTKSLDLPLALIPDSAHDPGMVTDEKAFRTPYELGSTGGLGRRFKDRGSRLKLLRSPYSHSIINGTVKPLPRLELRSAGSIFTVRFTVSLI